MLSACSSLWSIDEDAPPPPPIREVRQLKIPADLSVVRPAANPYTAAILATQTAPAQANGSAVATLAKLPESSAVVATKPIDAKPAKESLLFAPYFPSEPENKLPQKWETKPSYGFPWINGAEPNRVNQETLLGSGDRMTGRVFAIVNYDKNIPLQQEYKPVATESVGKQDAVIPKNEGIYSKVKRTLFGADKKPEVIAKPEPYKPAQQFVQCDGATCLDAARNALVADAKIKNWEILLNRRVSLHQSFQFRKNDRIVLVEITSDGKKKIDVEYGLLPAQTDAN
jgi:hypothetical protein